MSFDKWKVDPKGRFNSPITTAVKLDGTVLKIGGLEKIGGEKVTRHHIIDIRTLQDVWNKACDFQQIDVLKDLALWAGTPPRLITETMNDHSKPPNKVIQYICWNPFNIVIGPGSSVRPSNPGDREFDFIAYVDNLSLVRLEFNEHVKRLRRIERYMKMYVAMSEPPPATIMAPPFPPSAPQNTNAYAIAHDQATNAATVRSLTMLLKADRPSAFPTLFKMLREQEKLKPKKAEMDKETDAKRPKIASVYSPDYIPGALLDPLFWDPDYSSRAQVAGSASF